MSYFKHMNPIIPVEVTSDIVDPDEVDVVHRHALEALLYGSHCAFFRVVVYDLVTMTVLEKVALFAEGLRILLKLIEDEAPDLAAEDVFRAFVLVEFLTQADF